MLQLKNLKCFLILLIISLSVFIVSLSIIASAFFEQQQIPPNNNLILNLQKSIDIALENNLTIKGTKEKFNEAIGKIKETNAAKKIQLSFEPTYTKLNESSSTSFSSPPSPEVVYSPAPLPLAANVVPVSAVNPNAPANNYIITDFWPGSSQNFSFSSNEIYDIKLTVKKPIFTFGKLETAVYLAKLGFTSLQYEYEKVKQQLIFDVQKGYFGVLQAKHFVKVAEQAVETGEEHLKIAKALEREGVGPKFDVLRVEVATANLRQKYITATNGLNLAKAAFASLLGPDINSDILEIEDIEEPKSVDSLSPVEQSIEEAYKQRPEILEIQNDIKILENNLKLSKLNNKPIVFLAGNYETKKGDRMPVSFKEWWNATIGMSFPFFDSGETKGKIQQANSKLRQILNGLEQLKQGIALEVRQAIFNIKGASEKISVASKTLEQADEGLRLAKERYKNGVGTNIDVLDAQTALTEAKTNYYNALYEYQIAMAEHKKAIGSY